MARAAAMAGESPTSPILTSPSQEIDMSLKSVGLGSPPIRPLKRSLTPQSSSPSKKSKISPNGGLPRKKASRKLAFDEDKTSPVSGTIIRELAEGEEVPAIRKGKRNKEKKCRHNLLTLVVCFRWHSSRIQRGWNYRRSQGGVGQNREQNRWLLLPIMQRSVSWRFWSCTASVSSCDICKLLVSRGFLMHF